MIIKDKEYHLSEIVKQGLLPNAKTYHTARKIVLEEFMMPKSKRILKATIYGNGNRRAIKILGKNLAEYIKSVKN